MSMRAGVLRPGEATDLPGDLTERSAEAVLQCRRAQAAWADRPLSDRLAVVTRFRRRIAAGPEAVVAAVREARDRGASEILSSEVLPLADAAAFLEREAPRILAPRRPAGSGPRWLGRSALEIDRLPLGVVLVVAPSNYPLFLPGVQVLQALAAGNAALVKPAPGCSAPARALAELLRSAGLPDGLLAVLDEEPEAATAAMDAGVDQLVLTGSERTGREVLRRAADTLTPAVLELSGCDAVFLHETADLALAARGLRFGMLLNGGATCIAPRRVFVPRSRLEAFEQALRGELDGAAAENIAPETSIRVRELLDDALDQGARVLAGGAVGHAGMRPTVLTDTPAEARLLREEIFAPLLALVPVDSIEAALAIDARCPYALGASVFGDPRPARELGRRLRAGVVVINDLVAPTADPRVPFGGAGRSGHGSTRGAEGLLELTRPRSIIDRPGTFRPHFDPTTPTTERLLAGWLRAAHAGTLRERLGGLDTCLRALARMARPRRRDDGARQTQE